MTAVNTTTVLDTVFKYKVADKINSLMPSCGIMQKMIPKISKAERLGRKFLWPVALTYENGVTYGDGTAFSYEASIAGVYDEIEIESFPVVLRSQVSIASANRMKSSEQAFITNMSLRTANMKESLTKRAEIEILHGKIGLGKVSSITSAGAGTETITFTDATWAPGIWGGMEGSLLEVRNGASLVNSNADVVLSSVNVENKTITVTGNATDLAAVAATHDIFFKGSYANSMNGIYKQLQNTGTLFGIDASSYNLWKANSHAVGGALVFSEVLEGAAKAVGKGGLMEDAVLVVSAKTFEKLNADLGALREMDQSYSGDKLEIGTQNIVYRYQGGKLEVVAHPINKEGEAALFPKNGIKRIGTTDITFGFGEGQYFEKLEGSAGFQVLCQYDYSVLISQPAKCVYYSGITN